MSHSNNSYFVFYPHNIFMSKPPKIYKHKKLNNANFANFTLQNYQIFLSLISKIKKNDKNGQYIPSNKLNRQYNLSAKEYTYMFNGDIKNSYKAIRNTADKLIKTDIRILTPDDNQYWRINVCSKAEYKNKEGIINIKFTDDIMPYLAQVKEKFILYNLKEISYFKSIYTIRLYELVQEYKETGWILKSVDQLREVLTVGKTFALYADFKRFTFKKGCDEINKLYDLNLKFEEIKKGRKVISIKFTFYKTKVINFIDPFTKKTVLQFEKPKLIVDPKSLKRKCKNQKSNIQKNNVLDGQTNLDDIPKKQKTNISSIASITNSVLDKIFFWNKK